MSGRILDPKWGDKSDTMEFELLDERTSLDQFLPSDIIKVDYFPNAPDQSIGFPLSVLYGWTKTVCPLIHTDEVGGYKYYLIAGHHVWKPPLGWFDKTDFWTFVYLDPTSDFPNIIASTGNAGNCEVILGSTADAPFSSSFDIPITYLRIDVSSNPISDESRIHIKIAGFPGGFYPTESGSPSRMRSYPEDAAYLLYNLYAYGTGFGPDKIMKETFQSAWEDGLHKWVFSSCFNGFGSDRTKTIDTIHRRLLPQLPVFEYMINGKLGISFINIWGRHTDHMAYVRTIPYARMHWKMGYNILDRSGKVEEGKPDEVYNDFNIKFALDINSTVDGWTRSLQYTHGEPPVRRPASDDFSIYYKIDARCKKSFDIFGHRSTEIIFCQDLGDFDLHADNPREPVIYLAEFLTYFYTFRPKYLNLIGDQTTLWARPGHFITYQEDGLRGFENGKTCLIIGQTIERDRTTHRVRTWENMLDPGTDVPTTTL